jgi:hypothetical protein
MDSDSVSDGSGPQRLEGRARRLLRAYPPGYREHRGEEILGTLMEAAPPGRSWPSARDTASVIAGGLRARREANQRPGLGASLRQAALLGITLYLLIPLTSQLAGYLGFAAWKPGVGPASAMVLLPCAALVPLAAAWCGRRRITAVTAVIAGAAFAYAPVRLTVWDDGIPARGFHLSLNLVALERGLAVPLLALVALVLVTRDGQRLPWSWLWLPVLGAGLPAVFGFWLWSTPVGHALNAFNAWVTPWPDLTESFPVIMAALCVCWLVTDFRPLAGVALSFALTQAFIDAAYPLRWSQLIETGVAVVVALAVTVAVAVDLARRLRRQARTAPPAR